ncbi:MAG: zf-HC2 domain-containing protein [Bryobacterales bacterium]|nr:zf-HC2 domain-containing protein [Bryobacterales bacterium]
MSLLTCKDFLSELSEYLDETTDPDIRRRVEVHVSECPNCFVVFDTTKKTLQIYKGMEPQPIPQDVHSRLMAALEKRRSRPA